MLAAIIAYIIIKYYNQEDDGEGESGIDHDLANEEHEKKMSEKVAKQNKGTDYYNLSSIGGGIEI